jgi:hypothetical protein
VKNREEVNVYMSQKQVIKQGKDITRQKVALWSEGHVRERIQIKIRTEGTLKNISRTCQKVALFRKFRQMLLPHEGCVFTSRHDCTDLLLAHVRPDPHASVSDVLSEAGMQLPS